MSQTSAMVEVSDIGVFLSVEDVWPQLCPGETTLLSLLSGLSRDDTEPPRVCRRPFRLSHAAMA